MAYGLARIVWSLEKAKSLQCDHMFRKESVDTSARVKAKGGVGNYGVYGKRSMFSFKMLKGIEQNSNITVQCGAGVLAVTRLLF